MRKAGDRILAAIQGLVTASRNFKEASSQGNGLGQQAADLHTMREKLEALANAQHLLRDWTTWCSVKRRAIASNLSLLFLVELIEAGKVQSDQARAAFRLGDCAPLVASKSYSDANPVLRNFRRFQHENAIKEYREIDDLVRSHSTQRVISAIAHGLPAVQSVPRNSELGLLRHQMELQRPSQSIRHMISKMPQSFSKLAPCMLMSPLSIAQDPPPDQALFDVVIFDEASQITTWDAVGAIARARQTIIVGDPNNCHRLTSSDATKMMGRR